MNIKELPAGRELDAFIAENVMKWKLITDSEFDERYEARVWVPCVAWVRHKNGFVALRTREDVIGEWVTWAPSTDRGAAEEVEEQLNREGWIVIVANHHDGNLAACMIVKGMAASYGPQDIFLHLHEHDGLHSQHPEIFDKPIRVAADTASHAICLAAYELYLKTHE